MTTIAVATPTLAEVLDVQLLAQMLSGGYVRTQVHPDLPLVVYNYTEKAAYEGVWNPVTLTCRGLVVDTTTSTVVARPFPKFFNYGQTGAPTIDPGSQVIVTDKLDGSLGVLFPIPAEQRYAIATRGSFISEQALHATAVWRDRYAQFTPPAGLTLLFEIVFPANRIVVDYGDLDDLVLLGAVDIATGRTYGPGAVPGWPGPVCEVLPYRSFAEALAAPPRPNREGLVVHLVGSDERVKLKQADYVALHRIVTGLNARVVWRHLAEGLPLDELVAPLPDEFHPWCREVAASIAAGVDEQMSAIEGAYAEVVSSLPAGFSRRDFAAVAVLHPLKWALFLMLDGRDPRPELWRRAEPAAFWTPAGRVYGEDTA